MHLDREEGVLEVRDPERSLHRVVVGDRDEIHPPGPGHAVDPLGLGEGFTEPRALQRVVAAVGREARVDVEVARAQPAGEATSGICTRCS